MLALLLHCGSGVGYCFVTTASLPTITGVNGNQFADDLHTIIGLKVQS